MLQKKKIRHLESNAVDNSLLEILQVVNSIKKQAVALQTAPFDRKDRLCLHLCLFLYRLADSKPLLESVSGSSNSSTKSC